MLKTMDGLVGRRCTWILAVSGVLAGGLSPSAAQSAPSGNLGGVVVNVNGLVPIARAEISLDGTPYRVISDLVGAYRFVGLPPGRYRVIVRRIGFAHVVIERYTVQADSTHRLDFALTQNAVVLDEVEVTGAPRAAGAGTRSVTVLRDEDLTEQGDILQALRGRIPSMRFIGRHDDARIRFRGGNAEPIFVVNGIVARPPLRFYIASAEVACVEVRRGRQAAMEYRSSAKTDVYNGVVLIWTKEYTARMTGACRPG